METVDLYRPTGRKELEFIIQSDFRKFPPRLETQPFFYPVLNEEYAIEIAKGWNAKSIESDFYGCVTRFKINKEYIEKFEIHKAGNRNQLEYWIPSEKLDEFNDNIVGKIEVLHEFKKL